MLKNISIIAMIFFISASLKAKAEEGREIIISNQNKPVEYFIGRQSILENIIQDLNKQGVVIVTGIKGVGKTELARSYAKTYMHKYDIIWFIDSSHNVDSQFVTLGKEIESKICVKKAKCYMGEKWEQILTNVHDFLKKTNYRWLIIYDNWDANQKLFSVEGNQDKKKHHVILLSRYQPKNYSSITMNPFEINDSIALLQKLTDRHSTQDLEKIFDFFHGHPLLIVQAGQYLNANKYLTIDDFLSLQNNSKKSGGTDLDMKGESFFKIIFEQLRKKPNDIKVLKLFITMDNHNLSKELLFEIYKNDQHTSKSEYMEFLEALTSLFRYKVINYQSNNKGENMFEMHDFTKESLKDLFEKTDQKEPIEEVVNKIVNWLPDDVSLIGAKLEKHPDLLSNLQILLKNVKSTDNNSSVYIRFKIKMLIVYMYYLNYPEVKNLLDELELNIKILKQDGSLKNRVSLVNYYLYKGMYNEFYDNDYIKSTESYYEALGIANVLKDNQLLYTIYCLLSQIKIYNGYLSESRELLNYADSLVRKKDEKLENLGLFYFIRSKIEMEKGVYQEALNSIDESIRHDHISYDGSTFILPSYILKAEIFMRSGKVKDAGFIIEKNIMPILDKKLEADHELRARALNVISLYYLEISRKKEALDFINHSIQILTKVYNIAEAQDAKEEDFAVSLMIKGDILSKEGSYDEALHNFKLSYKVMSNRYQTKEIDLYSLIIYKLAKTFLAQNNIVQFQNYLLIHEEHFGVDHIRTKELYKEKLHKISN